MKDSEILPIYVDTYQLVRELYQITHKFPKEYMEPSRPLRVTKEKV